MDTRFRCAAALLLCACGDGGVPEIDAGPIVMIDGGEDSAVVLPPDAGPACTDDLECDDGDFCNGAETCDGDACAPGTAPCAEGERCIEDADGCDSTCAVPDADGDGVDAIACGGIDCDDEDPRRFPGATEVCDTDDRDEDCDPFTFGFRDADSDGVADARCCNVDGDERNCGDDCHDTNASVRPGSTEACDEIDNDCDLLIDEDVLRRFYLDADGDLYGVNDEATNEMACFVPTGYSETAGDCDDTRGPVHPGALDACDAAMVDDDCDGVPNNPLDGCTCNLGEAPRMCMALGVCLSGTESCVAGRWSLCSVAPVMEMCDGRDEDCDGVVDDGVLVTCFVDGDGDGYATTGAALSSTCPQVGREMFGGCPFGSTDRPPAGATLDCDDTRRETSPGTAELCNGRDEDCDGIIDEGFTLVTVYTDTDGDGRAGTPRDVCPGDTGGLSTTNRDCDETNPSIHADAADAPDDTRTDTNCDGIDGDTARAIFVAPAPFGDDSNIGTRLAPVASVHRALTLAGALNARQILIAAGTYTETGSPLFMLSNVSLYGGYVAPSFVRDPVAARPILRAGNALDTEAVLCDAQSQITIDYLQLEGANAGMAGVSAYGLRSNSCGAFTVRRSVLVAGNAREGILGTNGMPGMSITIAAGAGRQGCEHSCSIGCDCDLNPNCGLSGTGATAPVCPMGTGNAGGNGALGSTSDGAAGSPGQAQMGMFGLGGAGGPSNQNTGLNCANPLDRWWGRPGADGTPGSGGTDGNGGLEFGSGNASYMPAPGSSGTYGGNGGGGGGGGSGGGGASGCDSTGSGGGGGGAGACGGEFGRGGGGGGGAFAAWVFGGSVRIEQTQLSTGVGADGGRGGNGGTGGTGGPGGAGGPYAGSSSQDDGGCGARGGAGGGGGEGGSGGGGGGGPNIGIVFRACVSCTEVLNMYSLGASGVGGMGDRMGAMGLRADVHRF